MYNSVLQCTKIHALLTYSAVKRCVSMGSWNLVPAVSPMSGSPTFDTKKNNKTEKSSEANFITLPRPTGRQSNYQNVYFDFFTI